MPDYQRMYTIMVDGVEKVLDEIDRRLSGSPPEGVYLQVLKQELTAALQKAEDVYIDTAE